MEKVRFCLTVQFFIAHITGKKNTTADFLSHLETEPTEKIILTVREDVRTQQIEVNIETTGIAQEDPVFFILITLSCHPKNSYGNGNKKNEILYRRKLLSSLCHSIRNMTNTQTP